MEIELKLLVAPEDVAKLRAHELLQRYSAEKPYQQKLLSTYFDTPDLQVQKQQAALRVRKTGKGWLQTLKGGGKVEAGLHQRNEWEGPVKRAALDLDALRELVDKQVPWDKLLRDEVLAGQLEPVFTTRITRTIWNVHLPDGTQIECALDQGTVEHGDKRDTISELELELKAGDPQQLFGFALQLLDDVPLRIGNASKAERGYALYAPQPCVPVRAEPITLSAQMTVEQGFQAIAAACIAHFQGNEAGVLQGNDPESLHQMRVGLRRLRSAFKLFSKVLAVPQEIQDDFAWLAGQLGAARDWEVLVNSTLAAADVGEDVRLAALRRAAARIADEQRKHAVAALVSERATRLLLRFGSWLVGTQWRVPVEDKTLDIPLRKFAARTVVRAHRKLLQRGHGLRSADAAVRHRARIAAKRLRYAIEFFQSLYSSKKVRRYADALAQLQEEFGWFNDVAVAEDLLLTLQPGHLQLAADAAYVRGYLHAQTRHRTRHLHKSWKRFTASRVPRPA